VPASVSGLRDAVRWLQQGGLVVTGMDRPSADPQDRPCFFGRPAALPVHYAYLAMKARVPVCVVAPIRRPDGKYHVISSDLIEMDPLPDRASAALRNAEKVLATAEQFIRAAPEQWSVPLPVWPDLLPLVPD
jgi:KDO2-lipid IV(A) lauroyltransferase